MSRNLVLVGITTVAVAGAVAGLGWLFSKGGPSRRALDTAAVVDVKRGPRVAPPPARVEPKKQAPGPSTPKDAAPAPETAPADVCAKVDELLRAYDAIVTPQMAPNGSPDLNVITNLRERNNKIEVIVEQLAALGPPAVPCMVDAIRLNARLNRVDVQSNLVRALAKIPGRASLEALAELLSVSDAWGVKMSIVAQLADHGGPEGLAILAQRLEREQDFRIRGAILKYLGQGKSEAGILAARRLAQSDENPNVRTAALRALDESKDKGSLAVIEERARLDEEIMVRQNAIQVYGRVAGEQGLAVIEEFLRSDPNFRIKTVAILALQEMAINGADQARASLERYANDPTQSEDVRARATGALAGVDRGRQGTGLPSVGAKLEGVDPGSRGLRPLQGGN